MKASLVASMDISKHICMGISKHICTCTSKYIQLSNSELEQQPSAFASTRTDNRKHYKLLS